MTPLQSTLYSYALDHRLPALTQDEKKEEFQAKQDYDQAWDALKQACPDAIKLMLALDRTKNRMTDFEVEAAFLAGLSVGLELAIGR